jgi:hypothetical protein
MTDRREGESRIYVQSTFDLTELDDLSQGRGQAEGVGVGKERKQSEATTVWIETSRGSSQEVLVSDPGLGISK